MSALLQIKQCLDLVKNGILVGSTACEIYNQSQKNEKLTTAEKVQLAANVVFVVLQSADIAMTGMVAFAPEQTAQLLGSQETMKSVNFGLTVSAGVAHVASSAIGLSAKQNLETKDIVNVIGVVIFRASNIFDAQVLGGGQQPTPLQEWVGFSLGVAGTSVEVYTNHEKGWELTKQMFRSLGELFGGVPVVEAPNGVQNRDQMEALRHQRMTELKNWRQWSTLPDYMHHYPQFRLHLCSIMNRPARRPCIPRGHNDIFYEQQEIMNWLKKAPHKTPPKWPNGLPFVKENIELDGLSLAMVDQYLANLDAKQTPPG